MILRGNADEPLYRRVYDTLRSSILDGSLAAGSRLPGTRTLARDLGVSRIVVLGAFEQLAAEGYVVATVGSGTRVAALSNSHRPERPEVLARGKTSRYAKRARSIAPHTTDASQARIDFSYGDTNPDARTMTMWRQALSRAVAGATRGYPDSSGFLPLRKALARYLRQERGVITDAEAVLIVNGSQQALDLTARVLCDPGTVVGIEDPHYQGTRAVFEAAGARLAVCATDGNGLDINRHARKLRDAAAVCVTPSHQFPTGVIMPVERRLNLLEWAEKQGSWIVEDDYDCEFRYGVGAIPALQGLDSSGRVIYIGTFARTLFPALRLGYMVVPPALVDAFRAVKWLADRGSSLTPQRALATLIESGTYESSRRRMARALASKRKVLLHALQSRFAPDEVEISGASSGTHLYLRLRNVDAVATDALLETMRKRGVGVYDARSYHVAAPSDARLIVGYTTIEQGDIEPGIAVLAEEIRHATDHTVRTRRSRDSRRRR